MKVAIVIPALNEATTVRDVVTALKSFGQVILVDDGSRDGTGTLAAEAGAVVVRHEFNRGYDAALASGFEKAIELDCDVIASTDADGQIGTDALLSALMPLYAGTAELVIGVRDQRARLAETLFGCYTQCRYSVPDILCGLKAFTATIYKRYRALAMTPSIHTALALAALRDGTRFATIPVRVMPRLGASRFGSGMKANWRILRVLCRSIVRDWTNR